MLAAQDRETTVQLSDLSYVFSANKEKVCLLEERGGSVLTGEWENFIKKSHKESK